MFYKSIFSVGFVVFLFVFIYFTVWGVIEKAMGVLRVFRVMKKNYFLGVGLMKRIYELNYLVSVLYLDGE